jgi:hypothetical protein
VRALLTPHLARQNPTAYAAHFERLSGADRAAYLTTLRFQDLPVHLEALKQKATAGLQLWWDEAPKAIGVVAGKALPPAGGWLEIEALSLALTEHATTLAADVSALLVIDVRAFLAAPLTLHRLSWSPTQVEVHRDGVLEWLVKGTVPRGTFWSKAATITEHDARAVEAAARQAGVAVLSR